MEVFSLGMSLVVAFLLAYYVTQSIDHYHIELIPIAVGSLFFMWSGLKSVVQKIEPETGAIVSEEVINATANDFAILLTGITFLFGLTSALLFKVYKKHLEKFTESLLSCSSVMLAYITSLIFSLIILYFNVSLSLHPDIILAAVSEGEDGAWNRIIEAVYEETADLKFIFFALVPVCILSALSIWSTLSIFIREGLNNCHIS